MVYPRCLLPLPIKTAPIMFDLHPYFVALAYGLSALILVLEQIALRHRRRKALALVLRDRDLECETDLAN